MKSEKQILILTILLLFTPFCSGAKEEMSGVILGKFSDLEFIGKTKLKKFGIHIYDATFYADSENFTNFRDAQTKALSITYARNIRVNKLLSRTAKEWKSLGLDELYPTDIWINMLGYFWPDVNKGDQIVLVSTVEGKNFFYHMDKHIGTIDDKNFGDVFLSIWLDENSRYKKNRNDLLGK